jgi:hypothetical protein
MEITFGWKIFSLNTFTAPVNGLNSAVKEVVWAFTGKNDKASWTLEGVTRLSMPASDNFVAWENLTKENVVSWIEATENVQELKDKIREKIENLTAPASENLTPPFGVI